MRARILGAVVAVCVGACQRDVDDFPLNPGGGGGGRGGSTEGEVVDAALDGDGGTPIRGRVCLVTDLRRPFTGCATSGAGGLTVQLGSAAALTEPDGSFDLAAPADSNLTWAVTSGGNGELITSLMALSTEHTIPAIRTIDYADLLNANGVLLPAGQGAIVATLARAGSPLVGATARTNPDATSVTFYDGFSATLWDQDATGAAGTTWIPGITAGIATLRVLPPGGGALDRSMPIGDQAITFASIDLP